MPDQESVRGSGGEEREVIAPAGDQQRPVAYGQACHDSFVRDPHGVHQVGRNRVAQPAQSWNVREQIDWSCPASQSALGHAVEPAQSPDKSAAGTRSVAALMGATDAAEGNRQLVKLGTFNGLWRT